MATDEVMMRNEAECSEATVDIKIKTLDSQTYSLRVNKYVPVPALKEQIATVTGVLSGQQRLICRGKVMKDDQLLSAYHVEDGHTLHLVVRQPVHSSSTSAAGAPGSQMASQADPTSNNSRNRATQVAHRVVLGTFNVAEQGDGLTPDLSQIVSAVLSTIGLAGAGEGVGVVREYVSERDTGMSNTGSRSDTAHLQTENVISRDPLLSSSRLSSILPFGSHPAVIPDSLLTLSQYLSHLRHDFNLHAREYSSTLEPSGAQNVEQLESDTLRASDGQSLMPTPASLAEVMFSTRQVLMGQAAECLSQLASHLEGQASVTNTEERARIQSSTMTCGTLMQNLGALLLELGRTTMTVRMGNLPSEAVVNAGPAVFISRSGPNPIMVQPLPFQPGASLGSVPVGAGRGLSGGPLGSGTVPRNIDIRIHAGSLMPGLTASHGEHAVSAQEIPPRPSGGTSAGQSANPLTGESAVRVLPIRSMVTALSASGGRISDLGTAGGGVGLFYPLLARFQHATGNEHSTDGSGAVPNSGEGNSAVGGVSLSTNTPPGFSSGSVVIPTQEGPLPTSSSNAQEPSLTEGRSDARQEGGTQIPSRFDELLRTLFPLEQMQITIDNVRNTSGVAVSPEVQRGTPDGEAAEVQEASSASDEGVFLSNILREIMPIISQSEPDNVAGSSSASGSASQTGMDNLSELRSSQDRRDLPSPPDPKRQKRD